MAFQKYKVKDNAEGQLLVGLTAGATTVNLVAGHGSRFPSYGMGESSIATLVAFDSDNNVTKKERVTITARTNDDVTITRGFGGDTPQDFDADDYLYIYSTSAVVQDIQDEVSRLETDKLDKDGELRTGNGARSVTYNDGDGDEVEVALGASGTTLISNGPSAAPSFATPSVSDASETAKGIAEIATQAEVDAGTDDARIVTPSKAAAAFTLRSRIVGRAPTVAPGTDTITIGHGCSGTPVCIMAQWQRQGNPDYSSGAWGDDGTTQTQWTFYNGSLISTHFLGYNLTSGSDFARRTITSVDATNIEITRQTSGSWTSFTDYVVLTCFFQ